MTKPGLRERMISWFRNWFSIWIRVQVDARDDIGNPLHDVDQNVLRDDLRLLTRELKSLSPEDLPRLELAVMAAKEARSFYFAAQQFGLASDTGPSGLGREEANALIAERERMFSQKGMYAVILTISTAAFLQGHVQSSINAASLYAGKLGITTAWQLGGTNASPFIAAALLGAPLSLPTNYYIGRRGSLMVSAILIIASSVGSAFSTTWPQLLGVRVIGGVGMGIKAVSAPILASETAVGFWRGSTILTWQLWVACGIMIGFVINLVIAASTHAFGIPDSDHITQAVDATRQIRALQYILGSPMVPGVFLLVVVFFCYESPRFYMREDAPNYDPDRALQILRELRDTELQAFRDFLLIRWTSRPKEPRRSSTSIAQMTTSKAGHGLTYASHLRMVFRLSESQYSTLFTTRRLRNALWSTCTVNLAQQLCGINVFAFYSNTLFVGASHRSASFVMGGDVVRMAMIYSFLFGFVNFVCCIPAMRSIDTKGRRQWLLLTIPLMALFLLVAAAVSPSEWEQSSARKIIGIVFIFFFVAAYAPGLGPVPFTLASESFPLSHREAGTSVAICINLFFAGLLTILLPSINEALTPRGTLGLFSGLNVVAFVLVLFLVEETRRVSLEDLDIVFERPKREFAAKQLHRISRFVQTYMFFRSRAHLHKDPSGGNEGNAGHSLQPYGENTHLEELDPIETG